MMTMESISEILLATGYFSRVALHANVAQQDRLTAEVSLNENGHRQIARDGLTAFRDSLGPATTPIDFQFASQSSPWPDAALEKPEGLPAIWSHLEENGMHRLLLEISPSLSWFKGHFPEQPILAGVVQLNWAGLLTQQLFGFRKTPESIARLKFQQVVLPPAVLELKLAPISPLAVQFRYSSGDRDHSQGRFNFTGPGS